MRSIASFLAALAAASSLGGCASVKLSQRDGCWVRRTEGFLRGTKEELGPCARPQPPWVEDRLARLVQECEARADYRWQSRALAAWSRGERLPEQPAENQVLKECMGEATRAMMADNDALKQRLAEAAQEREKLQARVEEEHKRLEQERQQVQASLADERKEFQSRMDEERSQLHATNQKLADSLGEAAKKAQVPAVATATATSEGRARTDQESTAEPLPATVVMGAPAVSTVPARRGRASRTSLNVKPAAACEPAGSRAAGAAAKGPAAPLFAPSEAAPGDEGPAAVAPAGDGSPSVKREDPAR
jgi:hypothetical protein